MQYAMPGSDGALHTFKKGAFRIAIATGMEVVPVAVHGTWETWRPDAKMFFPGTASVTICVPIPVDDLSLADIDALRDQTRDVIQKAVDELAAAAS